MSDSTSGSSDWALVTQDGEIEDESEDDGSYSGSSIELLTSDEDTDNVPGEERRAGPFFVLRIRSKELLAESDSDEKEGPVDSLSKDEVSHVSSDRVEPVDCLSKDEVTHLSPAKGDNLEPEHLQFNSSDTGEKTYPELLRFNSSDSDERSEPELLQLNPSDSERRLEYELLQPDPSNNEDKSEPELQTNSSDSDERSEPELLPLDPSDSERNSEPELLHPDSSDNEGKSEPELQTNSSDSEKSESEHLLPAIDDNPEIHLQSIQNEHPEEETSLDVNLPNFKETGVDNSYNVTSDQAISLGHNQPVDKAVASLFSGIPMGTTSDRDTDVVLDDTPVTHNESNRGSPVESIPQDLSSEVKAEIGKEDQGISMATGVVKSVTTENESTQESADDFDLKEISSSIGTSSLGGSSFSLLNDDVEKCRNNDFEDIEGNMVDLDHNEDENDISFIEHDFGSGDITVMPEQEQQNNEHRDDTFTDVSATRYLDQSSPVVYRRSNWRNKAFILLLLEVFWVMAFFLAFFLIGYYQGTSTSDQIVKISQEFNQRITGLSRALKDTRDELDVFHTHFNDIRKLKDSFEQKDIDPEHIDWINSFSFTQKDYSSRNERCRNLDTELHRLEQYMAILMTTTFDKIKSDKLIVQDKHSGEIANLKMQINNLKNEKSDLEKDIIELGKKKYLALELEDENLALIKRISDMESQLMEAEDQSYVLQLQMSKLQKKTDINFNNEDDVAVLKQKLEGLENQRKYLADQVILHKHTIEQLKREKRSVEIAEAERWKVENVELKTKWGELSIKVQSLENELSKAYKKISDLEQELSDVKKETAVKPDIGYDFFKSHDEHQIKEMMKKQEEKERLDAEKMQLHNKFADLQNNYGQLLKKEGDDMSHDYTSTYNTKEDDKSVETEEVYMPTGEIDEPTEDKSTQGKTSSDRPKGEREENTSKNDEIHKSWSDAMNEVLNKTKSSMVNVSKQIQDTLSQVKNLSEELWKKHEPKVNQILLKTYENVKKNVNKVTEKVTKVTSKILQKSVKWMRKYKKAKKNRRRGKKYNNGDSDQATYTASTSRRQYSHGKNRDNHDYDKTDDFQKFDPPYTSPGFLEHELQSLNDSVEYINTLHRLNCDDMIDIMEDCQEFKKQGGLKILSDREKSWFFCQKSWFESMVFSDPSVDDSECLEELGQRQLAAIDHQCCPCLGQYGNYVGKFCRNDGCSHRKPVEKSRAKKGKHKKSKEEMKVSDQDEIEKNKTAEEDVFNNRGNFVYCDPFSHDLDCGDESWYLKRMKERDHLRKYRTSTKADWLFKRADDRDYERTKPDDWYFNRMSGGQAYEAFQDDTWYDENWYIRKIHDDKKNSHNQC